MKDRGIQVISNTDEGNVLDLKVAPVYDVYGKIVSGLVVGDTLEQNKAFILLAQPGDFKFMPTLGVGIEDMILDDDLLAFRHKIRQNFALDGLKITDLDLYHTGRIKIEAHYE